MNTRISVDELQVGMQIVNPQLDWKLHPLVYTEEKVITSDLQIEAIKKEGYKEVYIDLFRSKTSIVTASIPAPNLLDPQPAAEVAPTRPLHEELPEALKIHDESVQYARKFMNDFQSGTINLDEAAPFVDRLMTSLERNADALVSLSRLHHSDTYTYTHCVNVAILSIYFARYLGLPQQTVMGIGLAGMFHDVGKVFISSQILNAPRRLNPAEMALMQQHPRLGYQQLAKVENVLPEVLLGTLEHHEKYDGSGYPTGLIGDQISIIGRIIGVADVYDALTSKRVYKDAMFPHKALGIMYQMQNKHFDPAVIAKFIKMIGIYPVGSTVALEDGSKAVVTASNLEQPSKPTVVVPLSSSGKIINEKYDLAAGEGSPIVSGIPVESSGLNALKVIWNDK